MNSKKKEVVKKRQSMGVFALYGKIKSGESLLGVEYKPKKMEEAHSETRKCHRDLNLISMKERLYQREVCLKSLMNFFLEVKEIKTYLS